MRRGLGFHARRSPGVFNPASLFLGGTVQGAWFDPSDATTLFSDRAGTTPCGTPGGGSVVPVGAMLDKRAAGYSVFFDGTGDYLSFASDSGLALGAGQYTVELLVYLTASVNFGVFFSVTGGFQFSTNASNNLAVALQGVAFQLESTTPVTLNQWAHLAVTRDSGNTTRIFLNGSQIASAVITTNYGQGVSYANFNAGLPGAHHTGYYANLRVVKGTAVYTGNFTPPTAPLSPITGTSLLTCGTSWTGNPAITKNGDARVDGLNPFTASPVGNHAIAANDTTARPELRARVNFITYGEEFNNAAWGKSATSVAANTTATTDPLGGNTADTLTATAATNFHDVEQASITPPNTGTTYTVSFYIKKNTARYVSVGWWRNSTQAAGAGFDLDTGTITGTGDIGAGYSASGSAIQSVGNGWYRCSVVVTGAVSQQFSAVFIRSTPYTGGASTWFGETFTAAGTESVYLWGAQLTATNEFPANTYQRISDANTYDAVGFPRYLVANGTSSAMSTPGNVNLSGTDKVTVFAGVRKLSDAVQVYTELSADYNANNGTFLLWSNSSPNALYFDSRGTTIRSAQDPATAAAPASFVLTGQGNISAPSVTLRKNGTQVASNTNSQGTGNYGSYPLFIGARNNNTFFISGNLYSLIVVGSAVSAGQISATEQWVAQRTGITI